MADIDILSFPVAPGLGGNEDVPIVQGGVNKRTSLQAIANLAIVPSAVTWKQQCAAGTVEALPANTYDNGFGGIGATLTATTNGTLVVDGYAASADDRVLVKDETSAANNGIYAVTNAGDGSAPWVLTRAIDFDSIDNIDAGDACQITGGSTLAATFWIEVAVPASIGSSPLIFAQLFLQYTAGNGIEISGASIAIDPAVVATLTAAQTLLNKTLISPVITGIVPNAILATDGAGTIEAASTTGTGSIVLDDSPTLVTPDLGVPSFIDLTNAINLPPGSLPDGAAGLPVVGNGTGTPASFQQVPISTGVGGLAAGIAAFLGTASSANLASAVSDETGSGPLVFGTSPTLVSPSLGTPTSIVLTNGTGLPISSGVSGLGTGVATFLGTPSSANLAAAVTDETGTGALVFANSPVLVAPNLGTPSAAVLTNATGTAAGLTAGAANGLKSATTTVAVSAATAPTAGQVLTATSSTAANWASPTGGLTPVANRTALSTLSTAVGVAWLEETGRQGPFQWSSANLSTQVTNDPQQGVYVAPSSDPTGTSGAWVRQFNGGLSQYWFGAAGDGSTDDTVAVQATLNFSAYSGIPYDFFEGTHLVSSTINLPIVVSGSMRAAIVQSHAATLSPTMVCGLTDGTPPPKWQAPICALPTLLNLDKTGTGWTGFSTAVGLQLASIDGAQFINTLIQGFGVGVSAGGKSQGCAYNTFTGGVLLGNMINFRAQPLDDTGWSNQNYARDIRFTYSGSEGTHVSGTRDIQLIEASATQTGGVPDGWQFINCSVETDIPEYSIEIQGTYNQFVNCRFDASTPKVLFTARTSGQTFANLFVGGYGVNTVAFTYGGAGTSVQNGILSGNNPQFFDGSISGQKSTDTALRLKLDFSAARAYFGTGGISSPTTFIAGGSSSSIFSNAHWSPNVDNSFNLGASGLRWATVFAATGTINTSDAREKEWRGTLDEAETRVAGRLSKLVGIYQWKEAVEKKGDKARLHAGVTAQSVEAAFDAEGLDGFAYGVLCHDEWEAQEAVIRDDGTVDRPAVAAGDRYGVRYDELWAFVAAGFESRLAKLEQ